MKKSTLTPKKKKFAKEFVKSDNQTEAAFNSYNVSSRGMAALIGHRLAKDPLVIKEVDRIMEEQDITDEMAMQRLKEGMNAKLVHSYKDEIKQTNLPDTSNRHKYLDTFLKLKNMYPAQQIENKNLNIDVELEGMSSEDFTKLLKDILNDNETRTKKLSGEVPEKDRK